MKISYMCPMIPSNVTVNPMMRDGTVVKLSNNVIFAQNLIYLIYPVHLS